MIEARRNGNGMGRLLAVMRTLRAPGGCPWDREQTLPDLKTCLLEETYELLDAMAGDDIPHHAEELGDVLLQIVFQCQIREEEGRFNFDDVANTLADKLIRRHPHVFAGSTAADSGAVLKQWEAIKKTEKAEDGGRSALAGVPRHLPALLRAQRIQGKAANSGFDWPDHSGAAAKITEETAELEDAVASGDKAAMTHEVGDLLFSVVNLCRFLRIDAEDALQSANARFTRRFEHIENAVRRQGRQLRDCTLEELDACWDDAKKTERGAPPPP